MQIQLRSEETGLHIVSTFNMAFETAEKDQTIWKISWTDEDGTRCRLVRAKNTDQPDLWMHEPIVIPKTD